MVRQQKLQQQQYTALCYFDDAVLLQTDSSKDIAKKKSVLITSLDINLWLNVKISEIADLSSKFQLATKYFRIDSNDSEF